MNPTVQIQRLRPDTDADIPLPRYMTPQAAGMDICAAVPQDTVIAQGRIALLPTGFAVALPPGYEAQIRPRSGLAVKHGIGLINSPGTIDADYRGEVFVTMWTFGGLATYELRPGDRIAQLVVAQLTPVDVVEASELSPTSRGDGGHGSTGR